MKTVGIIAEYNPLHRGHRYHFEQSMQQAEASHALVVMSGNFVQRGEPAITDKFTRAAQAIDMGANLVLELPFIHAVQSADFFAAGAVRMLHESGVVDTLAFGSESAELATLQQAARKLLDPDLKAHITSGMDQGLSYAQAVEHYLGTALRQPNDILAVQYLKALQALDSPIDPLLIHRQGVYHDETMEVRFPSATAIRKAHQRGMLREIEQPVFAEHLEQAIFSTLLTRDLSDIQGMSEGIEHRLKRQAARTHNLDELIDSVRTPRFTQARLKRLLMHCLMHYTRQDHTDLQRLFYFRVLAYNEKGHTLLKAIKDRHAERLIHKIPSFSPDERLQRILRFDIDSSNLYYYLQKSIPEQHRKPLRIKND